MLGSLRRAARPAAPFVRNDVALGGADAPAMLLTDDYNPMDFFNVALHEKLRKNIVSYTHWDILLR